MSNRITDEQTEKDQSESGSVDLAVKPKAPHPMEQILKSGSIQILPKIGEIIEGIVIERMGPRVFVDLGQAGTGVIYGREFYSSGELLKSLKPGEKVNVKIVSLDNEEGYRELSLKEAGEERRWVELAKFMQEGLILELPVKEANRGGLIIESHGVKGFLPTSQLASAHYPRVEGGEKDKILVELQKLIGQNLKVKILDVNQKESKLIFTERGQEEEALRSAIAKYNVGDEIEGEITGVVDFGAFVKFDEAGLEGLIHISEIDWILIEDPRSLLKPGDKVKAKIIDIQGDKISLSLKALKPDPWAKVADKYHKGDMVDAKITKFNPFGSFGELEAGVQGLVHISEFGTEARMREELELGKTYSLRVLFVDPKEHRISLGLAHSTHPAESGEPKAEKPEDKAEESKNEN